MRELGDIKPKTPTTFFDWSTTPTEVQEKLVNFKDCLPVLGYSAAFAKRALSDANKVLKNGKIPIKDIHFLICLDAFQETFVPRSQIIDFLLKESTKVGVKHDIDVSSSGIYNGCSLDLIQKLPNESVDSTITSTPYWGVRIYPTMVGVKWADGEVCPYGHEQTPEGFIRHSVEVLYRIYPKMKHEGIVWWNVGDTYNTRTQIRGSASEALNAMKGNDNRTWLEHSVRRHSAGHSFLKDGELCSIPEQIAQRAQRLGYFLKSNITWNKISTMPEPVKTRPSKTKEALIMLSKNRGCKFFKERYNSAPHSMGGRNVEFERDVLEDVWTLQTSSGSGGHGAQFPEALPLRCILLSSDENDLILDPFIGSGTTASAAVKLTRRIIGFDVDEDFSALSSDKIPSISANEDGI